MKRIATVAALFATTASGALAAGIERANESMLFMFEEGNYAEFNLGYVDPKISGTLDAAPSVSSGNMASSYFTGAVAYKHQLNDNWHLGIKIEQPHGANVDYPSALDTGYPIGGSTADLTVDTLSVVARYETDNHLSVFGGLRIQKAKGVVNLYAGGVESYTMQTTSETDTGYLVGVAWERPDIAARVALTYSSAITHDFDSTEMGVVPGEFSTTTPQSVNLEFQTGVAEDTLLYGNIRWVEWTEFDISPPNYPANPLVSYADDTVTYNVGVGRKFTDTWSGALTAGYEKSYGGFAGNLGPTDGSKSIGVAAIYNRDAMSVTFGVRYVDIGDAATNLGAAGTTTFSGNSAIGAGVRVGYSF